MGLFGNFFANSMPKQESKLKRIIEEDGLTATINMLTDLTNQKISSKKVALQFVLEELDGASQGNETSIAFARNSGFSEDEYENAIMNSIVDVDGSDGPQAFLNILIELNDRELMSKMRIAIVDNIMQIWKLGKYEETIRHVDNHNITNVENAKDYVNQGVVYAQSGDLNKAIVEFKQAIKLNNKYDFAYYNLGITYSEVGESLLAIECFTKTIDINPKFYQAYARRGAEYYKLDEDANKAIKDFTEALAIEPLDIVSYYRLGQIMKDIEMFADSVENLTKVIGLDTNFTPAYILRGEIYYIQGNHSLALCDAEIACELGDCTLMELLKKEKRTQVKRLIDLVEKKAKLDVGIFGNIQNDLAEYISIAGQNEDKLRMMAYGYARRSSAAGLFLQGVFGKTEYVHASDMFKKLQLITGHTKEFQIDATNQSNELIASYDRRLTPEMISSITSLVELGLDKIVCLYDQGKIISVDEVLKILSPKEEKSENELEKIQQEIEIQKMLNQELRELQRLLQDSRNSE